MWSESISECYSKKKQPGTLQMTRLHFFQDWLRPLYLLLYKPHILSFVLR